MKILNIYPGHFAVDYRWGASVSTRSGTQATHATVTVYFRIKVQAPWSSIKKYVSVSIITDLTVTA